MRKTILPFMALGAVLMATAAHATERDALQRHHPRHHRVTPHSGRRPHTEVQPQASPPLIPSMTPFKHPGEGDNTGLSRNPDDCDTGCIGGNPD